MKANISNALIAKLAPKNKPYDVRDAKLTGFLVRVNISGKTIYMCEYARGKRITIGKTDALTANEARSKAKEILGDAAKGNLPDHPRKKTNQLLTLKYFIENDYATWRKAHRRRADEELKRITVKFFPDFGDMKLNELKPWMLEQWRTKRLRKDIKPVTLNRDLAALKAALSKAAEWEFIEEHPLTKLKPIKADITPKVRYLTPAEEERLRESVDAREIQLLETRESGNAWRRARGYDILPKIPVDHMKTMILLSLNTGIRQGELFSLPWHNVNLEQKQITIEAPLAKSGKTRHIPLNQEAYEALETWGTKTSKKGLVFPNKDGKRLNNVKKAWRNILKRANIENFRWHDMRHHFASRLVMAGVDLNTVRELLGHADLKMTLRYAHLAPEHKARAVEKLLKHE